MDLVMEGLVWLIWELFGVCRFANGAGASETQVLRMQDTAMDNGVGERCGSIQDLARKNVYSARVLS
jgi:hypothetical protein